jgi:hypothetical protein
MLRKTADIDEAAARPMYPLDQPRADQRDDTCGAQHCNDNNERGHGLDRPQRLGENRDGIVVGVIQSAPPPSQRVPRA